MVEALAARSAAGKNDSLTHVGGLRLAPYVPIPVRRLRAGPRGSRPRMLIARAVDDQVRDDANSSLGGVFGQISEVSERPEPWVDPVGVRDVVAAVTRR